MSPHKVTSVEISNPSLFSFPLFHAKNGKMCSRAHLLIDDLSEFPSLSNNVQPQHQNSSQAIWSNAIQRGSSNSPIPGSITGIAQRPQQSSGNPQNGTSQNQQQESQYRSSSRFGANLDEFRSATLDNATGQMGNSGQTQSSSVDEFPPLGRSGNGLSDLGQERRSSLMQSGPFGNAPGFGPSLGQQGIQGRGGLFGPFTGQSQPQQQDPSRQGGLPGDWSSSAGLSLNGETNSCRLESPHC
jgi:hypothetical protein